MSRSPATPLRLAVLISGSGRTLKNFIDLAVEESLPVDVRLVASSSDKASGLQHAEHAGIPTQTFPRENYDSHATYGEAIFAACRAAEVDYVAMAGFLNLVTVPEDFMGRVLNIHPSLIPAFCGQGMYGHRVHQAVLDHGAKITGCTVHFVDNQYDHGPIIWQQPVPVFDDDTADSLAERVFDTELEAYPHVLRLLATGKIKLVEGRVTIATR